MKYTPDVLTEKGLLYAALLRTTSELIQILNDHNEDTGDLPDFYEKIQKRALKCVDDINTMLNES